MKYITELLSDININPESIINHRENGALRILFEESFLPEKKMLLPEGDPVFREDPAPIGMSPANIIMELKRLYVFRRADLNPTRREILFIQLLENVHPTEARLLLAIKDQNLGKLYPNITRELVSSAGFIPPDETQTEQDQTQKRSRGRPRKQ